MSLLPLVLAACPDAPATTDGPATGSTATTGEATAATVPTSSATDSGAEPTATSDVTVTVGTSTSTATDSGSDPTVALTDTSATSDTAPSTDTTDPGTGDTGTTSTGTGDTGTTSSETGDTGSTSSETGASETGASETGDTDTTGPALPECTPGQSESCYGGPPESQDVGPCHAGERTCEEPGVWGPCSGQVLPAAEDCVTPEDEDCDGENPCGGVGPGQWSKTWGGSGRGLSVAFNPAGDIILAAQGHGSHDFGGGPLPAQGTTDLYLVGLAPDGQHKWSRHFGGPSTHMKGVEIDIAGTGDIVMLGNFSGVLDLGGGPLVGNTNYDTFLARFTPDGKHVWSKRFTASKPSYAGAPHIDPAGDIVITGSFTGSLDLGGGPMMTVSISDPYVAKFDGAGKFVWSKVGSGSDASFARVVTDSDANIYIAGSFAGKFDLGGGELVYSGGKDAFIARFDPAGTLTWAKSYGAANNQYITRMVIDGGGRITVVGLGNGVSDYGGGPVGNNKSAVFALQIDTDGEHQWSRLVSDGIANAYGLAVDGAGFIVVTGDYHSTVDFGGGPVMTAGSDDVFLVNYSPKGQYLWSQHFGGTGKDSAYGVAAAKAGAIVVTGAYTTSIDFGTGVLQGDGFANGFLAAFGP